MRIDLAAPAPRYLTVAIVIALVIALHVAVLDPAAFATAVVNTWGDILNGWIVIAEAVRSLWAAVLATVTNLLGV